MVQHDLLLTKQGPLARAWIAAHWERRLSKAQFLHASIPDGVESLVEHDPPVALRLCGQLLVGIVRLYARKSKYLEDDCNDVLARIQMAFSNGGALVDMAHEQLTLSRAAITLPDVYTAVDLLMPEPGAGAWDSMRAHHRHLANDADITLPDAQFVQNDIPASDDALLSEQLADYDTTTGFDLGLEEAEAPAPKRAREWRPSSRPRRSTAHTLPDVRAEPDMDADESYESVGVARDAGPSLESAADRVRALLGDVDASMDLSADSTGYDTFHPEHSSLALDASTPPRERPSSPVMPRDVTFDETIPAQHPLSPRTAAMLRTAAQHRAETQPKGSRKRPVQDNGRLYLAPARANAATMTERPHELQYLAASRTTLALLHACKSTRNVGQTLVCIYGAVAHDLGALLGSDKPVRATPFQPDSKQHWLREIHEQSARLNVDEEAFPLEVGRRAPSAPWLADDARFADVSNDTVHSANTSMGEKSMPELSMELPELPALDPLNTAPVPMDEDGPRRSSRHRAEHAEVQHLPEVRLGTPDLEDSAEIHVPVPDDHPLLSFERRAQESKGPTTELDVSTRRAMHILRTKIGDSDATIDFAALAPQASRRAAAGFFFELLVLGTRNSIQLEQAAPYAAIRIQAKPALWA
ncbi:sister chromatid cohesion protein 1 [Malassezia vespertilionis]|uniref:Mcd1p n=1 Tax=Malassezia vespertilionis TaxID=2020962 RepID=A0A2N1J7E2_9BASI|nr:sister chromatid cohesion protein 1 [Malassezia vespertilionis]PKI82477.1 Mcd1p [Malassezia vespertilionis]WFD08085.1 sister chromatid cohesion protein 1 [Malassezia vespertilionis]